jgi:hypothetical protein
MSHLDPLLEEALIACLAMTGLAAFVAVCFWLSTGLSPWPFVILPEIPAFGIGIVLLTLTSPRRR